MKKTLIAICGALSLAALAETQTPAQSDVIRIVTDEHNPVKVVVLDAGTESPRVCTCNPCKCDPCKCGVCEKKTVEFRPAPIPPAIGAAKGTPKPPKSGCINLDPESAPICRCGKPGCGCPKPQPPKCGCKKGNAPLSFIVDAGTTADQIAAFKKDVDAKISAACSKAVTAVCTCGKEPCVCPKTSTRIMLIIDDGKFCPKGGCCPKKGPKAPEAK